MPSEIDFTRGQLLILDSLNLGLPKHIIYGIMILAAGCSVIGLAFAKNTAGLVISMLIYGLGSGSWFLMVPLLLSDYLGKEYFVQTLLVFAH